MKDERVESPQTANDTRTRVFKTVAALSVAFNNREGGYDDLDLISDLGFDSLKLVDLTVALECALDVDEFPMQEWVDAQLASARPLTLGELTRACERVVQRGEWVAGSMQEGT